MWDQLPELILTQILSQLSRGDRASAGQVCRSWNRALSSPILWRSVTVLIDRDLRDDFPLAGKLAIRYGQHMRSLELAWSRPYVCPKEPHIRRNVQAAAGVGFLSVVRAKDVQLKKLILTDWIFSCKWGNRGKLLHALGNFLGFVIRRSADERDILAATSRHPRPRQPFSSIGGFRCQRNLETLSLLNANLSMADALRLLGIAIRSSGPRMVSLDLRGTFREWQAPHSNPRYLRLLGRLHALGSLRLDYSALSDDALDALASAASQALQTLHVSVRDSDSRQHILADAAWNNLVRACPGLIVSYTIVNISHHEDVSYLLLPSVPLGCFHMFSGHVWDQNRSRNFRSTVELLISYYTNTLAEVILQLRNNRESLDDLLVSMLIRCKRLNQLQYDGIIRSLATVKDMCQLQAEQRTHFRKIHVKPRNVNPRNRILLESIGCQYERKMHEQGVDFRIEDSASVFHFY
ncbi:F-box only protein 39 isoform X2 [Cephus cinctus]|uniref:F-box only protein 39 isoform X2 n=1 Tax=Cephus cinctus TaxID=211228 RepID=A0AAJ7RBS5_CEPCN|nr:F-box only protein 39 isoform X2 [Cephus cinctus]